MCNIVHNCATESRQCDSPLSVWVLQITHYFWNQETQKLVVNSSKRLHCSAALLFLRSSVDRCPGCWSGEFVGFWNCSRCSLHRIPILDSGSYVCCFNSTTCLMWYFLNQYWSFVISWACWNRGRIYVSPTPLKAAWMSFLAYRTRQQHWTWWKSVSLLAGCYHGCYHGNLCSKKWSKLRLV